ncbi:uncharacterized protein PAC_04720 [Phialocephala subalpina]|uniref:Heterokaryon incompatibility domain-containing protein n=1 Tax=Phialocephala subalpina TaxID=576137 RepID=A0A1L7WPY4_9HELO|nr:uncharacterized protein PAC_04720 [Phialocephala subalpina]
MSSSIENSPVIKHGPESDCLSICPLLDGEDPELDMYQYTCLPSSTSIRLIRLLPTSSKDIKEAGRQVKARESYINIQCSLEIVDLTDAPAYDALSYTWGNPTTVFLQDGKDKLLDIGDERCIPISYQARTILVTLSLYRALLNIILADIQSTALAHISGKPKEKYTWIDALCIDQSNIEERTCQVPMMDRIYNQAQTDAFARPAIETLMKIGDLPAEMAVIARSSPLNENRAWFKRAWVVQEVVFAQAMVVMCGSLCFNWELLLNASRFIHESRWSNQISQMAIRAMDGYYLDGVKMDPNIYSAWSDYPEDPGYAVLRINDASLKLNLLEHPHRLLGLIANHRFSQASDSKDKIYSLVAIASHALQSSSENALSKLHEIFRDVTWNLITSYGDLQVLSNIQDWSMTRTQGLPSWVPDYTTVLHPFLLTCNHENARLWSTCGDFKWKPPSHSMSPSILEVEGALHDIVVEVAELSHTTQPRNSNILKPSQVTFATAAKVSLVVPETYQWISSRTMTSTIPEHCQSGTIDNRESRLEALWRTLVADTFGGQQPAPVECGFAFSEWICDEFSNDIRNARLEAALANLIGQDYTVPGDIVVDSLHEIWSQLYPGEPGAYMDLPTRRAFNKAIEEIAIEKDNDLDWKTSFPPQGISFLPSWASFEAFIKDNKGSDPEVQNRVMAFRHRLKLSRKKGFQNAKELSWKWPAVDGSGGSGLGACGANVPFVLRRLGNGNFRVVGEAYVHGIMHGEALGAEGFELRRVVIE